MSPHDTIITHYLDIKHEPNKSFHLSLTEQAGKQGRLAKDTPEIDTLCMGTLHKGNPLAVFPIWQNNFCFNGQSCRCSSFLSLAIPEDILLPGNSKMINQASLI